MKHQLVLKRQLAESCQRISGNGLNKEKVNHPDHYNSGKFEAMDVIADAGYGEGFCLGNVLKYTLRAQHKEDEIDDLKKARWYLDYWIQLLEGKTKT